MDADHRRPRLRAARLARGRRRRTGWRVHRVVFDADCGRSRRRVGFRHRHMSSHLQAPWRMQYIRGLAQPESAEECFLCAAARATTDEERRARLVLWTSELSVVVINLFPYTNGHLLISPKA